MINRGLVCIPWWVHCVETIVKFEIIFKRIIYNRGYQFCNKWDLVVTTLCLFVVFFGFFVRKESHQKISPDS